MREGLLGILVCYGLMVGDISPSDDLDRFQIPTSPVLLECEYNCCIVHRDRLFLLRNVRGWSGGYWDDAITETDLQAMYWIIMCRAHSYGATELDKREQLLRLRKLIGDEAYASGWVPPEIPEDSKFNFPKVRP
jgi:hypothetical protein